jgi:hypothetical protein
VLALATPTWTVSADGLWTHGPGQLWLLLAVLALSARKPTLAGLAFAAAVLTRPHLVLAAAAAGAYYAWRERSLSALVRCAGGTAVGVAGLLVYNHQVFGSWSVLGGYDPSVMQPEGVGPALLVINVLGGLFSPHRGILVLTPFLLVLAPGLRAAWAVAPTWVRAAALGGLAYGVAQLYLIRFIGGHGFYSYRTLIEPLTLAAPLLLLAFREWTARTPARLAVFNATVVLTVFLHAFGAIFDQHRDESGSPWSNFSAWTVAEQTGPPVAIAWLVLAIVLAAVAAWWPLRGERS